MPMGLSSEHQAALFRRRRIVVNFDVTFALNVCHRNCPEIETEALVEHLFEFVDADGTQIDSIWWNWGEGNQAPYASCHLPLYDHPLYHQWVAEGFDIVESMLNHTRERGLEVFFSHRMNGSDNDLGPFARIPLKAEHPDWTFRTPWCTHADNGYWNLALPEAHEHFPEKLGEVMDRWSFDGLELDFARGVVFPQGEAWSNRHRLTDFLSWLREKSLAIAKRRGRPHLLAVQVPENLVGCNFDGLDVASWAAEHLVDIFVLGVRSFDVELPAFRRLVGDRPIQLYPSVDDHHASDGYHNPGIEVLRGVVANWWHQGADGIQTFNFNYGKGRPYGGQDWFSHLEAYRQVGEPAKLARRDKVFVVQRRGGGHGPTVVPNPEAWTTPRLADANTNMQALLPAVLEKKAAVDTLLSLYVGEDLHNQAASITQLLLRILLSDPIAATIDAGKRLPAVSIATIGYAGGRLENVPPLKNVEEHIRLRINNVPLDRPSVEDGWLVFSTAPYLWACGENMLAIGVDGREAYVPRMLVERVELRVTFHPDIERLSYGLRFGYAVTAVICAFGEIRECVFEQLEACRKTLV